MAKKKIELHSKAFQTACDLVVCRVKSRYILVHINIVPNTYLSSNQQQLFHSLPQGGALRLQERLGAGPGVVREGFLHQGLAAGFSRQQRLHGGQRPLLQVPDGHQGEADVGQELSGVGGAFRALTEPLQGGLKERQLALVLNLMWK